MALFEDHVAPILRRHGMAVAAVSFLAGLYSAALSFSAVCFNADLQRVDVLVTMDVLRAGTCQSLGLASDPELLALGVLGVVLAVLILMARQRAKI